MTTTALQTNYRTEHSYGVPGGKVDSRPQVVGTYVNSAPQTAQVATVTVDSHVASEALTVTINGTAITYTNASSGGSTSTSATGLAAAINDKSEINSQVSAAASTADVVITSRIPGLAFTITESEDNLSLVATTANDAADSITFGRGVIFAGTAHTPIKKSCRIAATGGLAAKVATATPVIHTDNVDNVYTIGVRLNATGAEYWSNAIAGSAQTVAGLCDDLIVALNAELPANTVVVTDSATHLTFTAEIEGLDFEVLTGHGDATAGDWAVSYTTVTNDTDISKMFLGVAAHSLAVENSSTTSGAWPANSNMKVVEQGPVWVTIEETIDSGDQVYVGVGSGHEGLFRASASGDDYLALPKSRAYYESTDGDGAAVLILK